MMQFSLVISPVVCALLGVALLLSILIIVWHARRHSAIKRASHSSEEAVDGVEIDLGLQAHQQGVTLAECVNGMALV